MSAELGFLTHVHINPNPKLFMPYYFQNKMKDRGMGGRGKKTLYVAHEQLSDWFVLLCKGLHEDIHNCIRLNTPHPKKQTWLPYLLFWGEKKFFLRIENYMPTWKNLQCAMISQGIFIISHYNAFAVIKLKVAYFPWVTIISAVIPRILRIQST